MLRHTFFIACIFTSSLVSGQTRIQESLTYKIDSSYNLNVAFEKAKKFTSNASLVESDLKNILSIKKIVNKDSHNPFYGYKYILKPKRSNGAAIVLLFGGGWRSGSPEMMLELGAELADLGYVVLIPSYPLSTHVQYPDAVNHIKNEIAGFRYSANKLKFNKNQIAVVGFSAGGMLASLIASTNVKSELKHSINVGEDFMVNALINIDGTLSFVHPESGEGDDSKKLSAATMWLGYKKEENYKLWEEASPLTHVNAKNPPTLFINSGIPRMHAGRDDFKKKLDEFGIYHEQLTFDIDLHHFPFFEPWFSPTVNATHAFLEKVFKLKSID